MLAALDSAPVKNATSISFQPGANWGFRGDKLLPGPTGFNNHGR